MDIDDYLEYEDEILDLGRMLLFGSAMSVELSRQEAYMREFRRYISNLERSNHAVSLQVANIVTDTYDYLEIASTSRNNLYHQVQ